MTGRADRNMFLYCLRAAPIELCGFRPPHGAQIETWCCTTREKGDCRPGPHHMRPKEAPALTTSRPKAREAEMDKDLRRLLTAYCRKIRTSC